MTRVHQTLLLPSWVPPNIRAPAYLSHNPQAPGNAPKNELSIGAALERQDGPPDLMRLRLDSTPYAPEWAPKPKRTDMKDSQRRQFMAALPALMAAGCATPPAPTPAPAPTSAPAPTAAPPRSWTDQPAFSIVRVAVRDGKAFGEYAAGHAPTIAAAGGRFLAAGSLPQKIEGDWPAQRMVIHQWPNAQAFLSWYDSPAYAPWKKLRHSASTADVILVQGVAPSLPSPDSAPSFVVIDVDVRDGAAFGRYVKGHMPGMRAAGGEFLIAGGRIEVIEGSWRPKRVVMHRWPGAETFRRWYDSAEYRPWREIRWGAAQTQVALVEGLSEQMKAQRKLP